MFGWWLKQNQTSTKISGLGLKQDRTKNIDWYLQQDKAHTQMTTAAENQSKGRLDLTHRLQSGVV
jgi:hypothetical protein